MPYDMHDLEVLASLKGLDLEKLKADIERREELSRLAWVQRQDPNWDRSKAHWRYEEVGRHQGRQVFFNDWHGLYTVRGLEGGPVDTTDPIEALVLLYQGDTSK